MERLPAPARAIASASTAAVAAARGQDAAAFATATAQLGAADPEQVRRVLGEVVRLLLEERYPDGADVADLQDTLRHCVTWAVGWYPEVDPGALVVVLSGSLGAHGEGSADRLVEHAVLLIADLLGGRAFATYLNAAFSDIAIAERAD